MWMNSMDIDEAAYRCSDNPVYADAARFLQSFRDLIASISDGWAYWSYGTKCSNDLQTIVEDGKWPARRKPNAVVKPEIANAKKKILGFLSRCQQTKGRPEVQAFLAKYGRD